MRALTNDEVDRLIEFQAENTDKWTMATMTMDEADRIVELMAEAILIEFKDKNGLLPYFDSQTRRIDIAIKLRVATELFVSFGHGTHYKVPDKIKNKAFQEVVDLYAGLMPRINRRCGRGANLPKLDSGILSFAEYCEDIGIQYLNSCDDDKYEMERSYWDLVYAHIGIEKPRWACSWSRQPKEKLISPVSNLVQGMIAIAGISYCISVGRDFHWSFNETTYFALIFAGFGFALLVKVLIGASRLRAASAILDRIRSVSL